jgi:hypothetical protein
MIKVRNKITGEIIEVSVGIDAPLTVESVTELGQRDIIFSGFVKLLCIEIIESIVFFSYS